MTIKNDALAMSANVPVGSSAAQIFADAGGMRRPGFPRVMLEAEGGGTGGGDEAAAAAAAKAAADKAAADKAASDKAASDKAAADKATAEEAERLRASGVSDAEAKLLKEVMEKKAEAKRLKDALAAFGDVDPAKVKELIDGEAKRAEARKKAEQTALEQKGEFDRVKQMMADEHKKQVEAAEARIKELEDKFSGAAKTIDDLTVGSQFANSQFVKTDLVLTPAKARALYGSHFALEDGAAVAYDKPAGAKERTKLVDASGTPLSFDAALAKIIEADPDKDSLKRSKIANGAGSGTTGSSKDTTTTTTTGLTGLARIQAALAAKKKS